MRALLAEGSAPEELARRVTETLGEGAESVLRADPWQLLAVPGVLPEQADGFARALLGDEAGPDDPRRAVALVVRLLERAALRGDTVLTPDALGRGLAGHAVPDPEEAVRQAVDAGAVLVFEDALDAGPVPSAMTEGEAEAEEEERPVALLVGLDRYALAEESLADGLARVAGTFASAEPAGGPADSAETADGAPAGAAGTDDGWQAAAGSASTSSARELIRAVAGSGLVTHTGGEASRGEVAAALVAARALGLRAAVLTHTDEGRERMARLLAEHSASHPDTDPDSTPAGGDPAGGDPAGGGDAAPARTAPPSPGCWQARTVRSGTRKERSASMCWPSATRRSWTRRRPRRCWRRCRTGRVCCSAETRACWAPRAPGRCSET